MTYPRRLLSSALCLLALGLASVSFSCASEAQVNTDAYDRAATAALAEPVAARLAKPTPGQIDWADTERSMFVHFGVATWKGAEYDKNGVMDLSKMNPKDFDAEQICAVAKSWGAGQIILVCKHVGGFCWWPTATTDYSVKNIPWKNGKGNLVKEVADACRRNHLKMGIYIYSDDTRYAKGIGRGGRTDNPAKQKEWSDLLRQQWTEVLTLCGPDLVHEVWFDGGCIVPLMDILAKYAPKAQIFAGPHQTVRWPCTESGKLPYPCWSSMHRSKNRDGSTASGHPDGPIWCPPECDTVLYGRGGHHWFWSPKNEKQRHTADELMDIYLKSVGRGGVMLLNSSPNTDGQIPEGDKAVYRAFGEQVERRFGHPLAQTQGIGNAVELDLGGLKTVNQVSLMEDLRGGHRIRAYTLEGRLANGTWQLLGQGSSVGHKKIDVFHPVNADRLRLRVTTHVGTPMVRQFTAFYAKDARVEVGAAAPTWAVCGHLKPVNGPVRLDLTAHIPMPASYAIQLKPAKGKVRITKATLLFNGFAMQEKDDCVVRDNIVYIRQTQQVTDQTKTELLLEVQSDSAYEAQIRVTSER